VNFCQRTQWNVASPSWSVLGKAALQSVHVRMHASAAAGCCVCQLHTRARRERMGPRKSCTERQKMVIWQSVTRCVQHFCPRIGPAGDAHSLRGEMLHAFRILEHLSLSSNEFRPSVSQANPTKSVRIGHGSRGEGAVGLSTSQAVRRALGGRLRPGYCEKCAACGTNKLRNVGLTCANTS
jgi:hypothetical protein